ncbi:MAG: hypothetical protein ACRDHN_07655 [Thermomicrobiales bacterium]
MWRSKPVSRRSVAGGMLGAAASWSRGGSGFAQATPEATPQATPQATPEPAIVLPEAFELPVLLTERDPRTLHMKQTQRLTDPAMLYAPIALPVSAIGFNPAYTGWEARNRLNLAIGNALIRTHAVSESKVHGTNYDDLSRMLGQTQMPDTPDWGAYRTRLDSHESLTYKLMAIPIDAPATKDQLQSMEADLRKGAVLNFTTTPGLLKYQVQKVNGSYIPVDAWTYRVAPSGQLQIDLYLDLSGFSPDGTVFIDDQALYSYMCCRVVLLALTCLTMTLGRFFYDPNADELFSYYNLTFMIKYLRDPNTVPIFFEEQNVLMLGEHYKTHDVAPLLIPDMPV